MEAKVLKPDEVRFGVKAVADFLLDVVNGKQPIPYQEKATVFNLYAGHLTKTKNKVKESEVWVGQLFFASASEADFNKIAQEVLMFLKMRGQPATNWLPGRDVNL